MSCISVGAELRVVSLVVCSVLKGMTQPKSGAGSTDTVHSFFKKWICQELARNRGWRGRRMDIGYYKPKLSWKVTWYSESRNCAFDWVRSVSEVESEKVSLKKLLELRYKALLFKTWSMVYLVITWEHLRSMQSWVLSQAYWVRLCTLQSPGYVYIVCTLKFEKCWSKASVRVDVRTLRTTGMF